MNKQEVFDKIATHLLTQKRQAFDEKTNGCVYRAPNGDKCAIGCLIPDEFYFSAFEQLFVEDLATAYPSLLSSIGLGEIPVTFLEDLQCIHDNGRPENWFVCLDAFALREKLSTDCLDPFRKNI